MTQEAHEEEPDRPVDPVAGKTVAEILGEIVWLMTQDPTGREMKVADIEKLIMPAILQRRFHIKYARVPDARQPSTAVLQPVSVQLYQMPKGGSMNILNCFSIPGAGSTAIPESNIQE